MVFLGIKLKALYRAFRDGILGERMSETISLEEVVNSVLDLPKMSKELSEKVKGLNLKYTQQYDGFSHTQMFDVEQIMIKYDNPVADITLKFPKYTLTALLRNEDLMEFYEVYQRVMQDFNFFQLKNPKSLSREHYVDFFVQSVDLFAKLNDKYQKLKKIGCLEGEEPSFLVKINLPEFVKPVYTYLDYLEERINILSNFKVEPEENLKTALDILKQGKNDIHNKIIKKYETFKSNEQGLIDNLAKGINLAERENYRFAKPAARILYEILS